MERHQIFAIVALINIVMLWGHIILLYILIGR